MDTGTGTDTETGTDTGIGAGTGTGTEAGTKTGIEIRINRGRTATICIKNRSLNQWYCHRLGHGVNIFPGALQSFTKRLDCPSWNKPRT